MPVLRFRETIRTESSSFLGKIGRYSRFVKVSKWALAGVVVIVGITMLAIPAIKSKDDGVRLSFTGVDTEGSGMDTSPIMENPKLQGVDKQNQPFMVTAKTAKQQDANTVLLDAMQADMTLKNERWLTVMAKQGILKLDTSELTLSGNVQMFHDQGYEMKTEKMLVNLEESTGHSDTEVEGNGPMGHIKAARFSVFDRGERIVFNGGVNMTVYPGGNQ